MSEDIRGAGGAAGEDVEAAIGGLLDRCGIEFDRVDVIGHAGDVAAIVAPASAFAALARVSREIKALGVRYVTIDLEQAGRP